MQHGFDLTDLTEQLGRARIERGREPRLRPREDRMEDEEGTGRDRRASPGTPLLKTESHASSFAATVAYGLQLLTRGVRAACEPSRSRLGQPSLRPPAARAAQANSSSRDQSSGFRGIFWIFVAPSRDGRPPVERTLISSCRRSACRLIGAPRTCSRGAEAAPPLLQRSRQVVQPRIGPRSALAAGHEYDEERDEQGSHVGHLRRRQCQFLFTARRSFRSFISTSNRSIRRLWTNFTSSRAAQRATP